MAGEIVPEGKIAVSIDWLLDTYAEIRGYNAQITELLHHNTEFAEENRELKRQIEQFRDAHLLDRSKSL